MVAAPPVPNEPNTPHNFKKAFALSMMNRLKDDTLVQEALPYVSSSNPQMRQATQEYLKAVGYKPPS